MWPRQDLDGGTAAVIDNRALRDATAAHVAAVNATLSHVEQVKRWTLLARPFEPGEELTPTLKVRRRIIAEKYATEIDAMYEQQQAASIATRHQTGG